jgi:hypothetical protein
MPDGLVINGARSGNAGETGATMPHKKTPAGNLEHKTQTVIAVHLFIF